MDAIKNRVDVAMSIAETLYGKIQTLYYVLDSLQSETEMLDYPEFDGAIGRLMNDAEDWLAEHKPSEDEVIAQEILARI